MRDSYLSRNHVYREYALRRNPNQALLTLLVVGAAGSLVWYMWQTGVVQCPDNWAWCQPATPKKKVSEAGIGDKSIGDKSIGDKIGEAVKGALTGPKPGPLGDITYTPPKTADFIQSTTSTYDNPFPSIAELAQMNRVGVTYQDVYTAYTSLVVYAKAIGYTGPWPWDTNPQQILDKIEAYKASNLIPATWNNPADIVSQYNETLKVLQDYDKALKSIGAPSAGVIPPTGGE